LQREEEQNFGFSGVSSQRVSQRPQMDSRQRKKAGREKEI